MTCDPWVCLMLCCLGCRVLGLLCVSCVCCRWISQSIQLPWRLPCPFSLLAVLVTWPGVIPGSLENHKIEFSMQARQIWNYPG